MNEEPTSKKEDDKGGIKKMNEDIKENEMYCPECGKLIDIDSINCKFCGENIDDVIKHSKIKKVHEEPTSKKEDEIFCKECGKIIKRNTVICPYCSVQVKELVTKKQINRPGTSIEPLEIISKDKLVKNNIYCPLYKHIDSIAKVSAVYASGVSVGRYSGTAVSLITPFSSNESSSIAVTPVSMGGINISELSRRLAPPPEPMYPSNFWFIIFLILACLSLLFIWLLVTLPSIILFGALATWQGIRNNNKAKECKEYQPIYEKAIMNWNKLYYCFRDDVVFNPETNKYASPEDIYNLIYNNIKINNSTLQA